VFSFPRSLLVKSKDPDGKSQQAKSKVKKNNDPGKVSGPISSPDEYLSHKTEFDKRYAEYTSLRTQIETTQKQFEQLGEQWKKASTSREKEELDLKIKSLYNEHYEKNSIDETTSQSITSTTSRNQRKGKRSFE